MKMKIKTYLKYLQTFAKNCFSGKLELFLQSPALNSHSGHFKNQKSWIMSTSHGFLTASFSDIFEFSVSKSKKSFQIMLMCDKKMICNWRNKGFCLYVYFSNSLGVKLSKYVLLNSSLSEDYIVLWSMVSTHTDKSEIITLRTSSCVCYKLKLLEGNSATCNYKQIT